MMLMGIRVTQTQKEVLNVDIEDDPCLLVSVSVWDREKHRVSQKLIIDADDDADARGIAMRICEGLSWISRTYRSALFAGIQSVSCLVDCERQERDDDDTYRFTMDLLVGGGFTLKVARILPDGSVEYVKVKVADDIDENLRRLRTAADRFDENVY